MSWYQRTLVDYSLGRSTKKEYLSMIETFQEKKESDRKYRNLSPHYKTKQFRICNEIAVYDWTF